MRTPKLAEFKRWARQHSALAHAVVMAQAFAELERERVDAYIAPILADFSFKYGERYTEKRGQFINKVGDLYLCDDEAGLKRFYECCDEAHRAHGFTGPHGHCPALTAENLQMEAERALIDAGCELMGIERGLYGENRAEMLRILMGACLLERKAA